MRPQEKCSNGRDSVVSDHRQCNLLAAYTTPSTCGNYVACEKGGGGQLHIYHELFMKDIVTSIILLPFCLLQESLDQKVAYSKHHSLI